MSRYEVVEHGPMATITVTGATLPELFENAAYAVFDLGNDLGDVAPTYSRPVVAPGDGRPDLLRNWLTELIAESDRAGITFCLFMVDRLEEGGVQGSASGMPVAETVRLPHAVVAVTEVDEPQFRGEEWVVAFQVEMGRRLRPI